MSKYPTIDINGFRLTICEIEISPNTLGRPESGKAYAIHAAPILPHGYYHCAYTNPDDAYTVMERMSDRFDDQVYRVNFNREYNPVKVRNNLTDK